jgi:predicted nucleic acid-binding protein
MSAARRASVRPPDRQRPTNTRYTIDASVFVNAFNPLEEGHAESLRILAAAHDRGDPVIVPTLLLVEIASAVARATGDGAGALQYAFATADLPHLTLVSMTPTMARQAAELAAANRLRGADAVYLAVARRYGTTLVSRDTEQRTRGSAIALCQTPEEALQDQIG